MWKAIKKGIRRLTPKKVKEFFAYQEGDEFATKVYSQEGEDLLLKRIFEHEPPGFYVDVGAHHPFRFSNTKLLYDKGWRGINIEPNPDVKNLFQKYRPRDIFVNCGVALKEGYLEYYRYDHPALNTFDGDQVKNRIKKPLASEKIQTRPIQNIIDDLNISVAIDMLLIDVEGFDLQVLQTWNWNASKPIWILIEDFQKKHFTSNHDEISKFLIKHNYALHAKLWNSCLYKLDDSLHI